MSSEAAVEQTTNEWPKPGDGVWVHAQDGLLHCPGPDSTVATPRAEDHHQCVYCGRNIESATPGGLADVDAANRLFTELCKPRPWAERAQLIVDTPPDVTAFLPALAAARRRNMGQIEKLLYAIRPSQERAPF